MGSNADGNTAVKGETVLSVLSVKIYGGLLVLGRWTCGRQVVGSTPCRVAIKWLVPGWVTVC